MTNQLLAVVYQQPHQVQALFSTFRADVPQLNVEVDRQKTKQQGIQVAAIEAARLHLRPILMTSFAFILGVLPLVSATGAGAEMRRARGTAVFFGMLGVTFFGLFLTPVFYVAIRYLTGKLAAPRRDPERFHVPQQVPAAD